MIKDKPLILVVENDESQLNTTSTTLQLAGFNIATASDGIKALASCRVRTPSLILLTLNMPMMTGREVYNRLRADERTEDIPVVFLLEREDLSKQGSDWLLGDWECLVKPIEEAELLARIKANLRTKNLKEELRKRDHQLKELALVDPITSLKNSRYFQELIKSQIPLAKRYKNPLSVLVFDVDQGKDIQRLKGQKGIDSLASQIAAIIVRQNRESDVAARLNPTEFALLLPNTDLKGAIDLSERIRKTVAGAIFSFADGTRNLTISCGVCQLNESLSDDRNLLAKSRDLARQSLDAGGNRTSS